MRLEERIQNLTERLIPRPPMPTTIVFVVGLPLSLGGEMRVDFVHLGAPTKAERRREERRAIARLHREHPGCRVRVCRAEGLAIGEGGEDEADGVITAA